QVTGSGTDKITINPSNNLILGAEYYVLIDNGAFQDPFGKDFAGISDPEEWNFTILIQGHISTNITWQDTILVTGDVTVDNGATLTVEAGTLVKANNYTQINIKGTLLAVGTNESKITFTKSQSNRWDAIRFFNTGSSNDSSKIIHCILEHAQGELNSGYGGPVCVVNFNKLIISDCIFRYNGFSGGASALDCGNCEFLVKNNIFHNNKGGGGPAISCGNNANVRFINNVMHDNQADNYGGAMYIESSQPVLINNTICNNSVSSEDETKGGGLYLNCAPVVVRNNIIYGNTTKGTPNQVYISYDGYDPDFYYCDIEGGKDAFTGEGSGENYHGNYEHNIVADPQFTGTGDFPYQLSLSSPCHNTGDPGTTTADVGMYDAAGNPRIRNGRIDIGAFEAYRISDNYRGNAISFDGTDDYIYVDYSDALATNHFSVEFWVKMPESPGEWGGIIDKGRNTLSNWYFLSGASSEEQGVVFGIGIGSGFREIPHSWNDTEWHHIAGTYDGTHMRLYVDGNHIQSVSASMNINQSPIEMGKRVGQSTFHFKGVVDEVRIWNEMREVEEIRENMYLPQLSYDPSLVSYWQMNESSGDVAHDYTGGNDGHLHHMDNSVWIESTIPFGPGYSESQTVSTTGNVLFTNSNVSMNFTAKTGSDDFVVTLIDTLPNTLPHGQDTVFQEQFWEINKYGTGTFTSDISFTLNENLTGADVINLDYLRLFYRPFNATGGWTEVSIASSVNDTSNTVTFNNIDTTGQLMVTRKAWPDNYPGNALFFDGNDDFVDCGNHPDLRISETITIEAWINAESWKTHYYDGGILCKEATDNKVYMIRCGDNGRLNFTLGVNGSWHALSTDHILEKHKWYHVACTYDGAVKRIYVNGEIVAHQALTGDIGLNWSHVTIGTSSAWPDRTFHGKIDEVRLWNVARTSYEIKENMHMQFTGGEDGLVSYWQFNDGAGTTTTDYFRRNDGTLHHFTGDYWITSPIPFGSGASNIQVVTSPGPVTFPGTDVTLDYTSIVYSDTVLVSKI
ncbi:MAG: hypothetical protein K8R53_06185, partial [Bacteroidales bacterium]|nr:hypothetical protein [Bacteroidales bacterium]